MNGLRDGQTQRVAAVIVHWGPVEPTTRLARALLEIPQIACVSIVANDRKPRPGALPAIVAWHVPDRNLGFAGGFEFALPRLRTEADILLCLNNDVEISEECVRACVGAFADSSVGIAAPILKDGSGVQSGSGRIRRPDFKSYPGGAPTSQGVVNAQWVTGAVLFIRRNCHERIRFNTGYFLGWEDVDICFRARRAGWRVVTTNATAWHDGVKTMPAAGTYYHLARNRVWFARTWGTRAEVGLVWLMLACYVLPKVAIADVLKRRGFARSVSIFHAVVDSARPMPAPDVIPADEPRPARWLVWQ